MAQNHREVPTLPWPDPPGKQILRERPGLMAGGSQNPQDRRPRLLQTRLQEHEGDLVFLPKILSPQMKKPSSSTTTEGK